MLFEEEDDLARENAFEDGDMIHGGGSTQERLTAFFTFFVPQVSLPSFAVICALALTFKKKTSDFFFERQSENRSCVRTVEMYTYALTNCR